MSEIIPIKEFKIKNEKYKVSLWGAEKSLNIFTILTKALGPAIGAAINTKDSFKEAVNFLQKDVNLSALIRELTTSLDENLINRVVSSLRDSTEVYVNNVWIPLDSVYDSHFQGKTKNQLLWLKEGIKAQYSDFFG